MDPATTTSAIAPLAMTTELWAVVVAVFWGLLFAYVPLLGRILRAGMVPGGKWGFGNRDDVIDGGPWVGRADRAYHNHLANLAPFIALVLVAYVTHRHDDVTATASVVFVVARIGHSLLYVAGVPYLRTLAFWASLGALIVITSRLFDVG